MSGSSTIVSAPSARSVVATCACASPSSPVGLGIRTSRRNSSTLRSRLLRAVRRAALMESFMGGPGPSPASSARRRRARVDPAIPFGEHAIGFRRPPGVRPVFVDRRYVAYHRIDDSPLRLDRVLSRKERRIAAQGVAEQPLIRRHLVLALVLGDELDILADHSLARALDAKAERDHDVGRKPQAKMIG